MDLKDIIIETDTHPYLMRMMRAYQDPGQIPARQDLLAAQYPDDYELPQTTGWLTMKGLTKQIGIDYEQQLKEAQEAMSRAMEDDSND
jgi:hypothetical protein